MKKIFFALALLALAERAPAYPDGAPVAACFTMTPNHGTGQPQTSQPQVQMAISSTSIRPGETVTIRIASTSPNFLFRGFLIQPRSVAAPSNPIGTMTTSGGDARVINCSGLTTVTHANSELKSVVVVQWTAPAANAGVRMQ